jgi:NADPH:quinone reductase
MSVIIRAYGHGGPEVLVQEQWDPGQPAEGEILIRHRAIGLNFIDTYYRSGLYSPPAGLPVVLGHEAAGVVLKVGLGVEGLKAGDRVAYVSAMGAYCTDRCIAANQAIRIPDGVSDEQAAANLLKGMTAEFLCRRTFPVGPQTTLLYHAAAGGVGLTFGQWARSLGALTIGTVGSAEKAEVARRHGFDHVINYRSEDFVREVEAITQGRLCDVVFDSVGRDTFAGSLECLKMRGLLVNFGQSSGAVPSVELSALAKRSLYLTRPVLFHYAADHAALLASAQAFFRMVEAGVVSAKVYQRYPLADVAQAHADLEGRRTFGASVLVP